MKLDKHFPTMVIGSLPRPAWVRDVIIARTRGLLDEEEADRLLDPGILFAIRMQERAGLDYISDGEWRRENYVRVFADRVRGFTRDPGADFAPRVTGRLVRERAIACDDADFLRRHTHRRIVVALPSPFTISMHLWHPVTSAAVYPHREAFVEDCTGVIREEILALTALGVDAIQLDEPWQAWLTSPKDYHLNTDADVRAAVELSIHSVNTVTAGLSGAYVSVHLCHSHGVEGEPGRTTFNPLMDAVNRMNVDRFAMEFNSVASGGMAKLKDFPADRILGLGVLNPNGEHVETEEEIIQRVERALEFVPRDRLVINPDCGFATSAALAHDLDRAYTKLSVMCRAAERLRQQGTGVCAEQ